MTTELTTPPAAPAETATVPAPPSVAETLLTAPAAPPADGVVPDPATAEATPPSEQKPDGAPEKYEFTFPEGVTVDTDTLQKFEPVLKELGLPNDKAQKLADVWLSVRQAEAQAQQERWDEQFKTWESEARADKEIGGQKFDENLKAAQSALARFGSPELKQLLHYNSTGLGSHPELIRFCMKIGKAMAEDTFVPGSGSAAALVTEATFYPTMQTKS